jgi:uncharacterized protein YndB with AHSA1/START domain
VRRARRGCRITGRNGVDVDRLVATVGAVQGDPNLAKFTFRARSSWETGGRNKGEIREFEPPRRLVHTHWSDVSGLTDTPEHYQVVAWDLTPRDGGTEVTITERNLPSDEAAKTSEQGWESALGSLKELLER